MPKGYIIAHVNVTDPEAYQAYVEGNNVILPPKGAAPLARGGRYEQPEGPSFERHVIMEFPSYEAALASYHSEDYQKNAEIRYANATSMVVVVEGV